MIQCFMLDDMHVSRYALRRYRGSEKGDKCPGSFGYHNAMSAPIADVPDDPEKVGICGTRPPEVDHADPRWPARCECGYAFREDDTWQVFAQRLLKRVDTGDVLTWEDAPAGAMFDASWYHGWMQGDDGRSLMVKLPGGAEWLIDGHANNCACKGQKIAGHHCWTRTGTPPNITAHPSILVPGHHGWLREGRLVPA